MRGSPSYAPMNKDARKKFAAQGILPRGILFVLTFEQWWLELPATGTNAVNTRCAAPATKDHMRSAGSTRAREMRGTETIAKEVGRQGARATEAKCRKNLIPTTPLK